LSDYGYVSMREGVGRKGGMKEGWKEGREGRA
jgi:hypothetical protein